MPTIRDNNIVTFPKLIKASPSRLALGGWLMECNLRHNEEYHRIRPPHAYRAYSFLTVFIIM